MKKSFLNKILYGISKIPNFLGIAWAVLVLCKRPLRVIYAFLLSKFNLTKLNFPFGFLELKQSVVFTSRDKFLDPAEPFTVWESWYKKIYVRDKNYPDFGIHEKDIVFDIGANKGIFTVLASRLAPSGQVYCFEPIVDNYSVLQENLKLNNCNNVKTENIAIGAVDGKAEINLSTTTDGHSLYWKNSGEKQSIIVNRLDLYCRANGIDRIDFLKMDCEGAEYDILSTMTKDMAQKIGKIGMEYHVGIPDHKPEEIITLLTGLGFNVIHFGGGFVRAINKNR